MTPKQMQDLALSRGMWACPQCPDGWQQYLIGSDMHICGVCGYKGGPVSRNQASDKPSDGQLDAFASTSKPGNELKA